MNGKFHHSLILVCMLAVLCLLITDNAVFCPKEAVMTEDAALLGSDGGEDDDLSLCYISETEAVANFPPILYVGPARLAKRPFSNGLLSFAVLTVLVSRRRLLNVPREERFFCLLSACYISLRPFFAGITDPVQKGRQKWICCFCVNIIKK